MTQNRSLTIGLLNHYKKFDMCQRQKSVGKGQKTIGKG